MRSIGVVICKIEDMNDDVSKEERANNNYTNKKIVLSLFVLSVCCVVLLLVHMCHSTWYSYVLCCAVCRVPSVARACSVRFLLFHLLLFFSSSSLYYLLVHYFSSCCFLPLYYFYRGLRVHPRTRLNNQKWLIDMCDEWWWSINQKIVAFLLT